MNDILLDDSARSEHEGEIGMRLPLLGSDDQVFCRIYKITVKDRASVSRRHQLRRSHYTAALQCHTHSQLDLQTSTKRSTAEKVKFSLKKKKMWIPKQNTAKKIAVASVSNVANKYCWGPNTRHAFFFVRSNHHVLDPLLVFQRMGALYVFTTVETQNLRNSIQFFSLASTRFWWIPNAFGFSIEYWGLEEGF